MKKILALAASSVLAISLVAAVGCDNKPAEPGTIKGDYKPADEATVTANLSDITLDSLSDVKGFDLTASGKYNAKNGDQTMSANGSASYKLTLGETALGNGAGEYSATYSMPGENGNTDGSVSGNVYNDATYLYASTKMGEDEMKIKVNYMDMLPGSGQSPAAYAEAPTTTAEMNLATLVNMLSAYKVTASLDTKDGVKVKLSASQDTLWTVAELVYGQFAGSEDGMPEFATIKSAITLNSFKFDVYLSFNKDKKFEEAALDVAADVKIDTKVFSGEENSPVIEATAELNLSIKTFNGTVTLPDLSDYEEIGSKPDIPVNPASDAFVYSDSTVSIDVDISGTSEETIKDIITETEKQLAKSYAGSTIVIGDGVITVTLDGQKPVTQSYALDEDGNYVVTAPDGVTSATIIVEGNTATMVVSNSGVTCNIIYTKA